MHLTREEGRHTVHSAWPFWALGLVPCLLAGAGCATGQRGSTGDPPATAGTVDRSFSRGTWQVYDHVGFGIATDGREDVALLTVGGGYHVLGGLSANVDLVGAVFDRSGPNPIGGGFNLLLRWHPIRYDPFSIYVDGAVGVLQANRAVPQDGSHFNFTPQVGAGITYRIEEGLHLMVGGRLLHLSNAGIGDSNPGINYSVFYAGIALGF